MFSPHTLPSLLLVPSFIHQVVSIPATAPGLAQAISLATNQTSTYIESIVQQTNLTAGEEKWYPNNTPIPDTDMTIHWTTTTLWFYTNQLALLYESTNAGIASRIETEGRYAKLVANSAGIQKFRNTVKNGIAIEIGNIVPNLIEWSDLEDVMKGLEHGPDNLGELCKEFLCEFEWSLGHSGRVGRGRTYRER